MPSVLAIWPRRAPDPLHSLCKHSELPLGLAVFCLESTEAREMLRRPRSKLATACNAFNIVNWSYLLDDRPWRQVVIGGRQKQDNGTARAGAGGWLTQTALAGSNNGTH